jgi:histidinol dehydrogenase
MRIIELEAGQSPEQFLNKRGGDRDVELTHTVAGIIKDVRERGDEALAEYSEKFDGIKASAFRVSPQLIEQTVRRVPREKIEALQKAADNIAAFHGAYVPQSTFDVRADGALVGTKVSPIDSIGLYVPGGRAPYVSTVLMNAIPAKVAGVRRLAMCTPPAKDGSINATLLAAAQIAGITEIYALGGAQAIAAMAYGTDGVGRVDKICGPGNKYVTEAKRQVYGDVGIDMIAGPSEVCILADEDAEPALLAIDLMAQAEHDPDAACYLITTDRELPGEVLEEIEDFLTDSPRAEITRESLENNGIAFITPDLNTAIAAVNVIAPEHLEIQMDDPMDLLGQIENAGAIFLGENTPESVGDYIAGPCHTLPTSGTARFSSAIGVDAFIKRSNVISYSYTALQDDAQAISQIALEEGFWAHEKAVRARFEMRES